MGELPPARAYLFDVFPRALARIAGDRLPSRYSAALCRFRHAPGVFKMDWALREPIPWRAAGARRAGTVHVGGTLDEIDASETQVAAGKHAPRPFVLVAQPTIADPSRAPTGAHVAWAYCHVPWGSCFDGARPPHRPVPHDGAVVPRHPTRDSPWLRYRDRVRAGGGCRRRHCRGRVVQELARRA